MSTPTDNFQTNTHSKKAHQKAGSRRARQFIVGVFWPESRVQVRQTTKQMVVQRFELGSPATARPLQGRLHQSPPPQSTTLHFSRAGPCFSGHTIRHQVEGHVKTRSVSRAPVRNFVPLRARSSERRRPKVRVWGVLRGKHAHFLPGEAISQWWCGKG